MESRQSVLRARARRRTLAAYNLLLLSNIVLSLAQHVQLRDIDATSLLTAPLIALSVCRFGGSGVHLFAGPVGEKGYEQKERRRCGC